MTQCSQARRLWACPLPGGSPVQPSLAPRSVPLRCSSPEGARRSLSSCRRSTLHRLAEGVVPETGSSHTTTANLP
jgi:hypothetical protein